MRKQLYLAGCWVKTGLWVLYIYMGKTSPEVGSGGVWSRDMEEYSCLSPVNRLASTPAEFISSH